MVRLRNKPYTNSSFCIPTNRTLENNEGGLFEKNGVIKSVDYRIFGINVTGSSPLSPPYMPFMAYGGFQSAFEKLIKPDISLFSRPRVITQIFSGCEHAILLHHHPIATIPLHSFLLHPTLSRKRRIPFGYLYCLRLSHLQYRMFIHLIFYRFCII